MTPAPPLTRREVAVATILVVAWLAATAWARPLLLPDEGRYVGVAWEMIRSGDWLTPTLNGLPFFHKPPLFYWITAGSMSLLGLNGFAARAAPVLGATLGALALYLFARHWAGARTARFGLFALLVQPLFYIGGQFANLDMLVAGFITATVLLLAHAALCVEAGLPHRRALHVAYAMAALGVLAKGLIGFVIPLLVIVPWLIIMRRWRALRSLGSMTGIAVFLSLAAPWFIAMQWQFTDFLDYFFVVQHFKRFATAGFNNAEPFWFYPAVLLLFSAQWLPWLYRSLTRGITDDADRGPVRLLMCVWVAMVVLFFSLPQSKLLGYVLPAVPPLAFLMADGFLSAGAPSRRARRLWWASLAISTVVSIGAVVTFSVHPLKSSREIATALAAQHSGQEPVFMFNRYYYDTPFYAVLREPVWVVEDWSNPTVQTEDGWRKELADAARFAPARSRLALVNPAELPDALCRAPVSWVVGPTSAASSYPLLGHARVIATERDTRLWRVDATDIAVAALLHCESIPEPIELTGEPARRMSLQMTKK